MTPTLAPQSFRGQKGVPLDVRFWAKVDCTGECWIWLAACDRKGYGHLKVGGKTLRAHRVAYELEHGEVPPVLDHLCRNRKCVRPLHLEPVTTRENILRGESLSAKRARQTSCRRGHEFTVENTYTYRGMRYCRACQRINQAKRSTK